MMDDCTTQFSIYKLDMEKIAEEFVLDIQQTHPERVIDMLLEHVSNILQSKRSCSGHYDLSYYGFKGIIFKTIHCPSWRDVLNQILTHNESHQDSHLPNDFLYNTNVSYILFRVCNDSIYVMTGGFGSSYVSKFIERNYGLYLLPKILSRNSPVVKAVLENNLTGNRTSTQRMNKANTSFSVEQDLSSIYKELSVEINADIARELGIELEENEHSDKKIHLVNKDALVIRRPLSLSKLLSILLKLNALEKKRDNFVLNYLVPVKKKNIKRSDLKDALLKSFERSDCSNFLIIGDEYCSYMLDSDIYRIYRNDNSVFFESAKPITLEDVFNELKKQEVRISYSFIKRLLFSWSIETIDTSGKPVLYKRNLIDTLQGFIEYGDNQQPCYLINGDWYIFDSVYGDLLNQEFTNLYKQKAISASLLTTEYNLIKNASTEEAYNMALKTDSRIIVSHKTQIHNTEIADAIFWDDETLYLMHNKGSFCGIGARDLLNQILTSAEFLQKSSAIAGSDYLRDYYESLCRAYSISSFPQVSVNEFIDLFNIRKRCFIACYIDDYKSNSRSTYAKYLTIEINKKLADKSFDFISMGIH